MSPQKYICLLCCKSFENSVKSLHSNSEQVLIEAPVINSIKKLVKSIGRRSHSARLLDFSEFNQFVKEFDTDLPRTGICSDCQLVATAICDLHHEIKCLELRLEWRIETLQEIMKMGGRVPSRLTQLKSHCDEIDRCLKMGENVSYIKIDSVRRQLMKACSTKLSNKCPRIVLRKYMKHETDSNSIPVYDKKPITGHNQETPGDLTDAIKKIISLVVISVIGLTTDTRNIRNPDQWDTADVAISPDQLNVKTDEPSINSVRTYDINNCSNSFTSVDDYDLHRPVEDGQREYSQSVESTLPTAENLQNDDDDDCMEEESTEIAMEQNEGLRKLRHIITCKHCPKTFSNSSSFEFHIKQCFVESGENEVPDCEDDDENQEGDLQNHGENFYPMESINEASDSETSDNHDSSDVEAPLSDESKPPLSVTARGKLKQDHRDKADKSNNGKRFACKNCPERIFKSRIQLTNHIRYNHGDDPTHFPLQCAQKDCQLRFTTERALRQHCKSYHVKRSKVLKIHRCSFCQKTFRRKENFELHRLSCGKKQSKKSAKCLLTCDLCPGSRFSYPVHLRQHKRLMHGVIHRPEESQVTLNLEMVTEDEPLPCEVAGCKERFSLPRELENHSKMHGQFSCSVCSEVMTFAPDLVQHEVEEHEHLETGNPTTSTKFQCPRCTFTLKGKSLFVKHFLSTHLNLDWATMICAICGVRGFTTNRWKRRRWQIEHFNNSHDVSRMNPEDVQKCDQCPAYFKLARAMNQHKRTVHGMKLKCGECGKKFGTRDGRRMHLLNVHKTEFSFSCSAPGCPQKFPCQDDLSTHIEALHKHETLNGELKTYKCGKCDHISKGKLEYMKHLSSHNRQPKKKEKPSFVCEQCGKAFKDKEKLQTHKLSHSGPDSWQFCCEICGRKFTTKYKLAAHGRTHTKEKPFQCSVCGEKYSHRHNLRNHVNKKHGNVVQDMPKRYDKSNLTSRKRTRKVPE